MFKSSPIKLFILTMILFGLSNGCYAANEVILKKKPVTCHFIMNDGRLCAAENLPRDTKKARWGKNHYNVDLSGNEFVLQWISRDD